MERFSDKAIEILNELHTERLDYDSEYLPLINSVNLLAAYEDTGLSPEELRELAEKKKNTGWILVKTKLPEESDYYLVTTEAEYDGEIVYIIDWWFYNAENKTWLPSSDEGIDDGAKVTAWKERSAPYKEEKE